MTADQLNSSTAPSTSSPQQLLPRIPSATSGLQHLLEAANHAADKTNTAAVPVIAAQQVALPEGFVPVSQKNYTELCRFFDELIEYWKAEVRKSEEPVQSLTQERSDIHRRIESLTKELLVLKQDSIKKSENLERMKAIHLPNVQNLDRWKHLRQLLTSPDAPSVSSSKRPLNALSSHDQSLAKIFAEIYTREGTPPYLETILYQKNPVRITGSDPTSGYFHIVFEGPLPAQRLCVSHKELAFRPTIGSSYLFKISTEMKQEMGVPVKEKYAYRKAKVVSVQECSDRNAQVVRQLSCEVEWTPGEAPRGKYIRDLEDCLPFDPTHPKAKQCLELYRESLPLLYTWKQSLFPQETSPSKRARSSSSQQTTLGEQT